MSSQFVRRFLVSLLLGALLAPVPFTRLTWADDWADETAPTDNPQTPGPDVYPNKRIEDGVVSMPNLIQISIALPALELIPTSSDLRPLEPIRPAFTERLLDSSRQSRAPPESSAA
ncbi:MAG: hypothetical protein ACHQPI_01875 [Thermoanaerobaculia bacterium]